VIGKIFLAATFLALCPVAFAADTNSSNLSVLNLEFDAGGGYTNSTGFQMFSTIGLNGAARAGNAYVCVGYLCFSLEQLNLRAVVTFLMDLNISGTGSENATVDGKGFGFYRPSDISKYFACVDDVGIPSDPAYGIVFSGRQLNYIDLENNSGNHSYIMRVSQMAEDNRFLLPATIGGCSQISSRLPMITLMPFVPSGETANAIEMFLSYPFIDIVGNYEKTGKMTLIMEKNSTNQIVVDVI